MRTREWCLLVFVVCWSWRAEPAEAGHWHVGVHHHVRPHCVTDYYGWHRPLTGFDSGFFLSTGSGYRSSFSSVRYSPWGWAPQVYPVYPVYSGLVVQQTVVPIQATIELADPAFTRPRAVAVDPFQAKGPNVFDVVQQHAERRANLPPPPADETVARPVSGSSRAGRERSLRFQAEGDRWLREGQNVKAYLRYLEAQREAEDRGEVYARQTFALVAMGRYSHAVSKLKRGLQVDPGLAKHGPSLDDVYGVENVDQKVDYLQRVADWANAEVRDPDRLFLMGALLHFDEDSRANEFLAAAAKLSGRGPHLQAFLQTPASRPAENPVANRRELPPPPAPGERLPAKARQPQPVQPPPIPEPELRGLILPAVEVPPEPARRQLILPDVYLPEESR